MQITFSKLDYYGIYLYYFLLLFFFYTYCLNFIVLDDQIADPINWLSFILDFYGTRY